MRYPKGHKDQTREQILEEAARAFRAGGVGAVSIAEIMHRLGLTHGGFYAHFPSKDALVAEACVRALSEAADALFPLDGEEPGSRLSQAIRGYLSRSHRDTPATGCLIPAVAGEVVHESDVVRHGFTEALRVYVDRVATILAAGRSEPRDEAADDALVLVAGMAGAVLLARAVDDRALSDRLLLTARRFYTTVFAGAEPGSTPAERNLEA